MEILLELIGIKIIFEVNGNTYSYTNLVNYPKELESKTYIISINDPNLVPSLNSFVGLSKVSFYYILNNSGKNITSAPIDIKDKESKSTNSGSGSGSGSIIDSGTVLPKIKAGWIYPSTTESELNLILTSKINTFIVKYDPFTNLETDIKNFSNYSKRNNVIFIPAINFVHYPDASITLDHGLYYDGNNLVESSLIPPLSRAYWKYLADKVKAISNLGSDYRVDGIFIDFEVYYPSAEKTTLLTYNSSYDNETFFEYVISRSLLSSNPPITEDRKFERYTWLNSQGKLGDYANFTRDKARELALTFKNSVLESKSDFIISGYPSPSWSTSSKKYAYPLIAEFFKGWENNTPGLLFGSETYYNVGTSYLPNLTKDNNAFIYKRFDTNESIRFFYVSGALLRLYSPANLSLLKNLSDSTNGYWLFSFLPLLRSCSSLPTGTESEYYRICVNCLNDHNNPGCCSSPWLVSSGTWNNSCCMYYEDGKQTYFDSIRTINQDQDSSCIYNSWVNNGCGGSGCPIGKMGQTRSVSSGIGCYDIYQCVDNSDCNIFSNAIYYLNFNGNNKEIIQNITSNCSNCPLYGVDNKGNLHSSVLFNGVSNQYISLGTTPLSGAGSTNFSFSVWVNINTWNNYNYNGVLTKINGGSESSGSFELRRDGNGGYRFRVWNQTTSSTVINSSYNDTVGTWHNYIGTVNSTTAILYRDGIFVGSANILNSVNLSNQSLLVGALSTTNYVYNGSIDDVVIWNRTLSSSEVTNLYNLYKSS